MKQMSNCFVLSISTAILPLLAAVRGRKRPAEAGKGRQRQEKAVRGRKRPSEAGKYRQEQLGVRGRRKCDAVQAQRRTS